MKHLFSVLFLVAFSVGCLFPAQAQRLLISPPATVQHPPTGAARQSAALAATIRYVKAGASGNGSSWSNASGDLQAMINASAAGDQVWIAGGTYKPSTIGLSDPRTATFSLKKGVSVLGGFTGATGTEGNISTRTAIPSSTTLSGDIGNIGDVSDNAYHVVYNSNNGVDNSAVLDGVAITGGRASGENYDVDGGGMFNLGTAPTILNCQFSQNFAAGYGGAMAIAYTQYLVPSNDGTRIINCSFQNNTGYYSGVYIQDANKTVLTNCFFGQNSSDDNSGALGSLQGLGLATTVTSSTLINCTFSGNIPHAIELPNSSYTATLTLTNSLLWNNGGQDAIVVANGSPLAASYCLIEAGETDYNVGASHNQTLTSSPFANGTGPQLLPCAPAIDAGNDGANSTATDVLGYTRKQRTIDIGAAEYQGSPYTVSVTVQATPNAICVGSQTSLQAIVSGGMNTPYTYTWAAPTGANLSNTDAFRNTATASATATGVYSFSVQAKDAIGCTATNTVSVTANALPTAYNVTGSGAYCTGGTGVVVGLSGSQTGVNYQLLRGGSSVTTVAGTGNALSFGPQTTAGAYTVQATNASTNCQQAMNGSASVSVNNPPTATLASSGSLTCANHTVTLTAEGGTSYVFSSGATATGPATATAANQGAYSVTVTDANGCTAIQTTTVQSNTTAPTVSLSSSGTLTCANKTVTLTAGGADTYVFSAGAIPTGPSTATISLGGSYSVTGTSTANGCSSFTTTTVESNTLTSQNVTLSSSGTITCTNRAVTLTAGGGGTYAFSPGATATGPTTATVTNEGPYSVTVTGSNGCTATQTTTVQSSTTAPNATLNNNGPLTANQPTVTLNAGGGNTYAFSSGASQQGGGNTATVTSPGTYQVTVTSSSNGCSATASTTVTGAVSASSCRNGTGVITVIATGTPVKYEWYRNSINSARLTENPALVRGTSTNSLTLVNQQVTADYYVRVTDANGSAVVYGPFRFTVNLGCNIYARQGAEEVELRISLLGNPIQGDQLRATISGAEGKALSVQLLDLSGRPIRAQQWQQAEAEHSVEWSLSGQPTGVYLLQATTPDQRQNVKVVRE